MSPAELSNLCEPLPRGRTLFYYFRDRYALLQLEHLARDGATIGEIKKTKLGPLLNRPIVREALARCGDGRLGKRELQATWPSPTWAYRLSIGRWPMENSKWCRYWHQMARPGVNLVLQMNFSMSDQRRIAALAGPDDLRGCDSHPIAAAPESTLAWARLDIDRQRGECLIEELQSDWSRDTTVFDEDNDTESLTHHRRLWPEAMLAATIRFCINELGLNRIFLYDHATGNRYKGFRSSNFCPPRSLYTDLPKRFCFRHTHNGPQLLRDAHINRRVRKVFTDPETRWWVMQLPRTEEDQNKVTPRLRASSG